MAYLEHVESRAPESGLRLQDFQHMLDQMKSVGVMLETSNPSSETVVFGEGDTGTIQTSADIDNSTFLLTIARPKFPGSFSEEDDPRDEKGDYQRLNPDLISQGLWMIDPIDGTGDRRYGQPGSPERKGFSILNTFVKDGKVAASIVVRPAYQQELIHWKGKTYLIENNIAKPLEVTSQRVHDSEVVRVNVRNAYPKIAFPSDFWDFAWVQTGINYQEVRSGGAGDSLSKLVLGDLDLVVARRGDWKAWDTGPFDPMIASFGGKMTDLDNNSLGGYDREDLWHHRGVVASIGRSDAHDGLVYAMESFKKHRGIDLVDETPARV